MIHQPHNWDIYTFSIRMYRRLFNYLVELMVHSGICNIQCFTINDIYSLQPYDNDHAIMVPLKKTKDLDVTVSSCSRVRIESR